MMEMSDFGANVVQMVNEVTSRVKCNLHSLNSTDSVQSLHSAAHVFWLFVCNWWATAVPHDIWLVTEVSLCPRCVADSLDFYPDEGKQLQRVGHFNLCSNAKIKQF